MTRGRPRVLPHPSATAWAPPPEILRRAGACASPWQVDLFYDCDRQDAAIAICSGCPVRRTCLDYAVDHEEHGVWGGVTAADRVDLRGANPFVSVDDRQLADRVRADVARGVGLATVASREGISVRTLERWLSVQRAAA